MASSKIFTLEGKGLKLDTAEDIEPHLGELKAMNDVEEVRILGNTLGVGACQRLGEVLSTKKSLKVLYSSPVTSRARARKYQLFSLTQDIKTRLPTLPTSSRAVS